jgi:hypothetical protein
MKINASQKMDSLASNRIIMSGIMGMRKRKASSQCTMAYDQGYVFSHCPVELDSDNTSVIGLK